VIESITLFEQEQQNHEGTMKLRFTSVLLAAVSLLGSVALHAQWFDLKTPGVPRTAEGRVDMDARPPRTADGKPDFSGLWVPVDARGSLFDSSKILGWAQDAMLAEESSFYTNDPRFHCLPDGPASYPAGMSVGGMRRMVQHPAMMVVLNPDMTYRQIFMDGRELEAETLLPTWLGYSVGRFEGDELVVESNGFNDKSWLTREGLPHTDQLHLTERYTRRDFGHLTLEITYEDPGVFTEPVQATVDMEFRADTELLEIVCNESETGRSHYSGEITQADTEVVEVPVDVLNRYVGVYQGLWLGNQITAEITVEDGQIFLTRTPRYSDTGGNTDSAKSRLVPQSETAFDCTCGLGFIFAVDESGEATAISEVHVSGAWPFQRVR
jgi:hypothetical protein